MLNFHSDHLYEGIDTVSPVVPDGGFGKDSSPIQTHPSAFFLFSLSFTFTSMTRSSPLRIFGLWLLTLTAAQAQGVMTFGEKTHDFGTLREGDPATHEFVFTNTGNQPIVISGVKASCGCTTPAWTKDPVLPGQKGKITAAYSSQGRPGAFHKSISVTSNAATPTEQLFIKGQVTQQPPSYSEAEMAASPRLHLDRNTIDLGTLEAGQTATATFVLKNEGREPLQLLGVESACRCVRHELSGSAIAPGQTGTLKLHYTPTRPGKTEVVRLKTNDRHQAEVPVVLRAAVVERMGQPLLRSDDAAVPFR